MRWGCTTKFSYAVFPPHMPHTRRFANRLWISLLRYCRDRRRKDCFEALLAVAKDERILPNLLMDEHDIFFNDIRARCGEPAHHRFTHDYGFFRSAT